MGWRDLIVTSHVRRNIETKPVKGNFEDSEDIEPRYRGKMSHFLDDFPPRSNDLEGSPISSELPDLVLSGPIPPIKPGWLVVYRDCYGRLCGGVDDRTQGTVGICTWAGNTWMVTLTNGHRLCLAAIISVAKTTPAGRVEAAWTVRAHGYDGEGTRL